jgi:tetratricopeptide (TPR) repeat protein
MFMQAYVNEMQENYEDAIDLYKEVVSSFKSSSYAPVSLSRIFNCLEKNQSSGIEYQSIQSYYNSIKTDTNNLFESRELSEDFVIKSKVKQGLLEDAILDYDNIYQNNTNNSKGQHALINKLCLLNMSEGGDNQSSSNSNTIHKTNLLALLQGKDIRNNHLITSNVTPLSFKLHQNYPNPFNPVTTIKYEIPSDNFVTIRIYDLLGREIFNSGEFKKAGSHEVKFDGLNFASGMYFYSMESGSFKDVKKMVLLK